MPEPRRLDHFHATPCLRRISPKTNATYKFFVKRHLVWSGLRHPLDMGEADVRAFLEYLASRQGPTAVT